MTPPIKPATVTAPIEGSTIKHNGRNWTVVRVERNETWLGETVNVYLERTHGGARKSLTVDARYLDK